ncbi:MAG: DUF3352 domain-containing protein [Chloroflexi bacterium]|nr:DUF3352 domain-containing protein [Chloroflexota bacterium]
MSILSRLTSTRVALVLGAALAIAAIVVLSFVLNRGVPVPTDGIGDIPTAHLVPHDAALYVALSTDLDSPSWGDAFDESEDVGAEDPLAQLRDLLATELGIDWEEEVEPFLGGAAVFFISSLGDGDEGDPAGAVIFRANDARAAEGVILSRRSDSFEGRRYRDVPYKVMEEGGVLAVIGDHFVYAADEPTLQAIVDTHLGDTRALADADDFRRLRNALEGDALAFVYIHPGNLTSAMDEALERSGAEEAPGEEPDILAIIGLDKLFAEPIGVVVKTAEDSFRIQAAMLGDPGPLVPLLRPRDSRFAEMVPAETVVFASAYDIAGVVDEAFGDTGLAARLRDAVLESADEEGELGLVEDILSLLDGETALAMWPSAQHDDFDFVLLAEVDNEEYARELLGELFAEPLDAGEVALLVEDGIAALGPTAAAIEAVLDGAGPSLAASGHFASTVSTLDNELATFAYVDITGLLASTLDELDGLDFEDDTLGFIVNLLWEDDRMQVEAALASGGGD